MHEVEDLVVVIETNEVMKVIQVLDHGASYRCINHEAKGGVYSRTELKPHLGTSIYDSVQPE